MTTTPTSPLGEVDERSLEAIFASNPGDLTDEEVGRVVEYFEAKRQQFLTSPEAKTKGPGKAKKVEADVNLKLEDLGL